MKSKIACTLISVVLCWTVMISLATAGDAKKREVSVSVYKAMPSGERKPAGWLETQRFNYKLYRLPRGGGEKRVQIDQADIDYKHEDDSPVAVKLKVVPGNYILRVDAKSYWAPFRGKKRFKVNNAKRKNAKTYKLLLRSRPVSKCSLRVKNQNNGNGLSGIKIKAKVQGENIDLADWRAVQLWKAGKRQAAVNIGEGDITNDDGTIVFPLWKDINKVTFIPSSERIRRGTKFTLTRKELEDGATVSVPIRPISVIIRPFVMNKKGERKRLTEKRLKRLTPPEYKDNIEYWQLRLYRMQPDEEKREKLMGNPLYDRNKEAFIWRVPYPKPGYVCQIAQELKMPLAGQKVRYPIRKKNLRFTVPDDLPYKGEITVLLEESQKAHPRVRLTGKVLTPEGETVEGARVVMHSNRTGRETWAETSPAGAFAVDVPKGRYRVEIQKPGYMHANSKCEVTGADKPQVFQLVPMPSLTVRVQSREGKPVPGGVVLLARAAGNERINSVALRKAKGVFRSVKPGRYAVVYMDTPYDKVQFAGADVFHDSVSLKAGEKKQITLSPPKEMRQVELHIDRDSGGVAADRPLALQLYRKSHGHSYVVYSKILGTKSSVDLTLPAGASYRPEFILGWTDKAMQKHGGDPLGIEDPDRYQDTVAYFGSRLKVPEKGVDGKRVLEIKVKKNTKHRTER